MEIPKSMFTVINQLCELEQKLKKNGDPENLGRNVSKMKDALAEDGIWIRDALGSYRHIGLAYEDPMGQEFTETRADLDATICGSGRVDLVVVEVVKPIIRAISEGDVSQGDDSEGHVSKMFSSVVQKGVVIVQSRKE